MTPVGRGWPFRHALALCLALSPLPALAQEVILEEVPRATRNVTPSGITPGPSVDGPLLREKLPEPEKKPDPAKWRRFALPETTDAGTFRVRGITIRVSGVDPVPLDHACQRADGEEWPCGQTALQAFRRFLGGRAVECFIPPVDQATEVIAPCRFGQIDIGTWLLRQGWGTPNDYATEPYRAAALDGRCRRLGMWQGTADEACVAPPQSPAH